MAVENEFKSLAPLAKETDNAYQAFIDYVQMGHMRSLKKLFERYQTDTEPHPTKRPQTIKEWSIKFEWQRRIIEYQGEAFANQQQTNREAYAAFVGRFHPIADNLVQQIESMLTDFQRLRVTRRTMIPDPRDPNGERQIESIQTKVNTRDLATLTKLVGQLGRDIRTIYGLPQVTEVQGIQQVVHKAYIGVDPDDWDKIETPQIPDIVRQNSYVPETDDDDDLKLPEE